MQLELFHVSISRVKIIPTYKGQWHKFMSILKSPIYIFGDFDFNKYLPTRYFVFSLSHL